MDRVLMDSIFGFALGGGYTMIIFDILLNHIGMIIEPLPIYMSISLFHFGLTGLFISKTGGLK